MSGGDTGRLEGARILKASSMNLLGRYNDDPGRGNAVATRRLLARESLRGLYRTPGLRNVAVTAPYLHDGRIDSLREALQHAITPPGSALTRQQVDDLAAFLVTLTDRYAERRPWDSAPLTACP